MERGELVVVIVVLVENWFFLVLQECLPLNNQRRWSHKWQPWCGCLMADH